MISRYNQHSPDLRSRLQARARLIERQAGAVSEARMDAIQLPHEIVVAVTQLHDRYYRGQVFAQLRMPRLFYEAAMHVTGVGGRGCVREGDARTTEAEAWQQLSLWE